MKKSNRIVLGLCMTAVVVFMLLPALKANAQGHDPIQVLFVKNDWYQQEDDILDHLNDLGCYEVTTKKDYQIYGSTDLSSYDLIIITEFAPGIGYYGLQNIENSGKPILIVEYWDFWYSYKLGLVEDYWAGYYGTDTVDVIDSDHTITYLFDETIQVYYPSYTIYGIPFYDIADGVTPLIYSSASFNEVAVLSDDDRQIVATGIYDTTKYTADGWKLFDMILTYLYAPSVIPVDLIELNQSLYNSGTLDLLVQISNEPSNWNYDSAMQAVWTSLVNKNITFAYDGLSSLVADMVD